MTDKPLRPVRGALYSLVAFTLWAFGDATVKHLGAQYTVIAIAFYDMCVLVAFLFVIGLTGKLGSLRTLFAAHETRWLILRGAIVAIEFSASMYAFTHETLAKAYALMFSAPLWTTAMAALFLKERVSRPAWGAILLGLAGVLVVLRPGSIPFSSGIAAALLTAFCLAIANLIGQQIGRKPDMTLIAAALVPQTVTLLCIAPFFFLRPPLILPAPIDFGWMAFIGVTSGAGFVLLTLAFIDAPAAVAAPFHYTQILWGTLFGALFFGSKLDLFTGLGAAIIIGSGLWLLWQSSEARRVVAPSSPSIPATRPAD